MKRAILWAFFFVVLVLLATQAIDSNRAELTRQFAFQLSLPFVGTFEATHSLAVAAYFAICILLGAVAVMVLSLGAVIKAASLARQARRELEECQQELSRLRGRAGSDMSYQPSLSAGDEK